MQGISTILILNCILLMTNDDENIFMCLLVICLCFCGMCLVKPLSIFIPVFTLVICSNSWYILDMYPWSDMYYKHFSFNLLIFSWKAFDNKTLLALIKSNVSGFFFFYGSIFSFVLFKKSLPIQDLFQSNHSEYCRFQKYFPFLEALKLYVLPFLSSKKMFFEVKIKYICRFLEFWEKQLKVK